MFVILKESEKAQRTLTCSSSSVPSSFTIFRQYNWRLFAYTASRKRAWCWNTAPSVACTRGVCPLVWLNRGWKNSLYGDFNFPEIVRSSRKNWWPRRLTIKRSLKWKKKSKNKTKQKLTMLKIFIWRNVSKLWVYKNLYLFQYNIRRWRVWNLLLDSTYLTRDCWSTMGETRLSKTTGAGRATVLPLFHLG